MKFCLTLIAGLIAAFTSSSADAGLLYAAQGGGTLSSLYTINPATGAITSTIGPIGFSVTGLGFDPITGILYGSTGNRSPTGAQIGGSLITIDPLTGVGTLVGSFGQSGSTMADLAFSSTGQLFGWLEPNSDDVFTINKATGASASVGNSGLSTATASLEFDATGRLWFLGTGPGLTQLNPATGAVIGSVGLSGATDSGGLGLASTLGPDGSLYVTGKTSRNLFKVNVTTGVVTLIGNPGLSKLDALAFAPDPVTNPSPEPTSLALLGMGVIGFARFARRRRQVA